MLILRKVLVKEFVQIQTLDNTGDLYPRLPTILVNKEVKTCYIKINFRSKNKPSLCGKKLLFLDILFMCPNANNLFSVFIPLLHLPLLMCQVFPYQ